MKGAAAMRIYGREFRHGLFLAPMAGVADLAFREICASYGAELTVSEMVSAKALCFGDKKTQRLLRLSAESGVCGIQLFGHEPEDLRRAAALLKPYQPAFIDINMGCPAPKIFKSGDGAALLRDPALCGRLTAAVAEAAGDVPVSVKLRAGIDEGRPSVVPCAVAAAENGAAAVTVHGRYREQFYRPPVDYDIIRAVKEAVAVPVIGNGDVASAESAGKMRQTGCDAVMLGRGALGNPFLFAELTAAAEGRAYTPPGLAERLDTAARHIAKIVCYEGEKIGMLQARKHVAWYLKGVRGGAKYRAEANGLCTYRELSELLQKIAREGTDHER